MCLEPVFKEIPYLNEFFIYIDGSNIAYSGFNKMKKPQLSNILLVIDYLIKVLGIEKEKIRCICDPSLKYYIDKPIEYKVLIKERMVIEAPKIADEFILSFALKHDFCFIISNDRFREYLNQLPNKQWLEERRISFMIIDEVVCLSPNMEYKNITKNELDLSEITTLEIYERILMANGHFDLY